MFIPIFTISPLLFIIGFTIFRKEKKSHELAQGVVPPVRAGSHALDFELLFFTSSIDSALILERKRQAPMLIGAATDKPRVHGKPIGIWS